MKTVYFEERVICLSAPNITNCLSRDAHNAAPITSTVTFMKKYLIALIEKYQKSAPDSLRNSCRFEPTCSNYMLQSIEKHGTVIGIKRGIQRLIRCRPPYGGIDKP